MNRRAEEWIRRATDPAQYDQGQSWHAEDHADAPRRDFFWEYLRSELPNLQGKTIVDIGSGTGWLSNFLFEQGAGRVIGIEPSEKNRVISRKNHPKLEIVASDLLNVSLNETYDFAVAVMSFEHIVDLDGAFRSVSFLLKEGGKFILIAANETYHRTPRFGYVTEEESLPDGQTIIKVTRSWGTVYDVVRSPSLIIEAGTANGFLCEKVINLFPTDALIDSMPKYDMFRDLALSNLYVFHR